MALLSCSFLERFGRDKRPSFHLLLRFLPLLQVFFNRHFLRFPDPCSKLLKLSQGRWSVCSTPFWSFNLIIEHRMRVHLRLARSHLKVSAAEGRTLSFHWLSF